MNLSSFNFITPPEIPYDLLKIITKTCTEFEHAHSIGGEALQNRFNKNLFFPHLIGQLVNKARPPPFPFPNNTKTLFRPKRLCSPFTKNSLYGLGDEHHTWPVGLHQADKILSCSGVAKAPTVGHNVGHILHSHQLHRSGRLVLFTESSYVSVPRKARGKLRNALS
ncbi:hypothetical protein E2562_010348 [Oryza meyeriana var. granulata]|uniref:Uncharacterized protein n=1 Tax=Oryza meyeriana var. granulata TaxID=110450 RepID=A0A6G1F6H7_9ORYZ|nr:hypothetical protein E2562_010348 [Oryza meyeriana var. granulata]